MIASIRPWVGGAFGLFVTGCSGPQDHMNVPDQPQKHDGTAVIILGGPSRTPEPAREPVTVAAEEPTVVVKPAASPTIAAADLATLVRDPRKSRWYPRSTPLLITELQSLEALHANTPANAPDKPKLLRRLAEDYIELKNAARRDKERLSSSSGSAPPARSQVTSEMARLDKVIAAARMAALKHYQELVNKHPNFCQSPHLTDPAQSHGCLDDTFYAMGLEKQEIDKADEARKHYYHLIKLFPQSKWVPYAYIGFGELFLAEGIGDPTKLEYAQKTYEQVVKSPPPQNETFGFAHYRLAQIHHQKHDEATALAHFVQAIDFSMKFAGLPSSKPLGDIARHEIVPSYAAAGTPRKAEAFFQRVTNDPSGTNEQVTSMLNDLVQTYLQQNKRVEAGDVCSAFSGGVGAIAACSSITPSALPPSP